jgi:hypothetical protein
MDASWVCEGLKHVCKAPGELRRARKGDRTASNTSQCLRSSPTARQDRMTAKRVRSSPLTCRMILLSLRTGKLVERQKGSAARVGSPRTWEVNQYMCREESARSLNGSGCTAAGPLSRWGRYWCVIARSTMKRLMGKDWRESPQSRDVSQCTLHRASEQYAPRRLDSSC